MAQPITRSKDAYFKQTDERMAKYFAAADWTPRQMVALSARILESQGHGSGLAGQISLRAEKPNTFYMLSFGLGFDEACASNILLVDDNLNVLEGEGTPNPSNRFHLWVYRARPDVMAICHSHPPYVSALSTIGEKLMVSHMDHSMFYDDCGYLPEWPGVPFGDEEGHLIAEALGNKKAILLSHHGQLIAGASMEEATVLAIFMERAARLQMIARAAGEMKPIRPECAKEAHDYRLKPKAIGATFHYFARRILKEQPECLE
ncbi:L-fuculose-phosphate aldolase OS=Castellaniella defragrans OX=75697 GN=HNR28_002622 PE=3 SV=1 [Castellaniella defragrans]